MLNLLWVQLMSPQIKFHRERALAEAVAMVLVAQKDAVVAQHTTTE
jgi:hypothetical protein